MTNEKCFTELDAVLNLLVSEELEKIPLKLREEISNAKDKNYIWEFDTSKPLSEQKLNRKTVAMLSYINMEYLQTEEQKNLMMAYHKLNEKKFNKAYTENQNNFLTYEVTNDLEQNNDLVEISNIKWYQKLCKLLKRLFCKK